MRTGQATESLPAKAQNVHSGARPQTMPTHRADAISADLAPLLTSKLITQ
jgi:hypothetical protein